jgi:large subunit ribosomal protein L6e
MAEQTKTKKFGKGERSIPHHSEKASKYYPADDVAQPKKARKSVRPAKVRSSLQPGTVVILLAGRFRGKRVVVLKHLEQGVLLVTGPFKVNGVPLRRVNARYVIATSTSVDVKGVDESILKKAGEASYFTKDKESKKPGEEAFFKQGEKPEVGRNWSRSVRQANSHRRRRRPPRTAWRTRSPSTNRSSPPSRRRLIWSTT